MTALARDYADSWQHNEQNYLNDFLNRRYSNGGGKRGAWDDARDCLTGTGEFYVVTVPPSGEYGRSMFEIHAIDPDKVTPVNDPGMKARQQADALKTAALLVAALQSGDLAEPAAVHVAALRGQLGALGLM